MNGVKLIIDGPFPMRIEHERCLPISRAEQVEQCARYRIRPHQIWPSSNIPRKFYLEILLQTFCHAEQPFISVEPNL